MEIIVNPPRTLWARLCERNIPDDSAIDAAVEAIIADVRLRGDEALREMAARFDHTAVDAIELSEEEVAEGAGRVAPAVADAIRRAAANIAAFHEAQSRGNVEVVTAPGVRCIQRPVAIRRVGLYIPGGRAPLFSTVLMLAIPASIAGCREVVLCTPQSGNAPIAPEILFAARLCGVSRIMRVGGAQAIAAMAYGTASVPRVDKIFGPGNRYVTKAKQSSSVATTLTRMPASWQSIMPPRTTAYRLSVARKPSTAT